jgi:hypothetical protein
MPGDPLPDEAVDLRFEVNTFSPRQLRANYMIRIVVV